MRKKVQVAIIDVGSSAITAVLGERGINKTFIIKGKYSYPYDGFGDGAFYDVNKLSIQLKSATRDLINASHQTIEKIYVGVPGEFTKVTVKDSQISFPKKKKITEEDIETLFDGAFVAESTTHTVIDRSAIIYELDDFRRLADPIGAVSEIFKGRLSFILCSNYFMNYVSNPIKDCGIQEVEFRSIGLAQTMYLLDAQTRDRIALVADIGYISTTVSVIQGDGIVLQKSFTFGGGYISACISERLGTSFETSEIIKRKVNLSLLPSNTSFDLIDGEDGYYDANEVKEIVLSSLDVLCENIASVVDSVNLPDYVPLMITGGGISYLRGAKEFVSNRLGMSVEIIAPSVPLLNKPELSSMLSLLDCALISNNS